MCMMSKAGSLRGSEAGIAEDSEAGNHYGILREKKLDC